MSTLHAYKAIRTRFVPCTNFRPSRVSASAEAVGPSRYGDRDCIGHLPTGEWLAFLANGYTHGPLASREEAMRCCNGACECWKRRDEMLAMRRIL